MATTIKLKNSVTTTNTPTSLAQGEVAINITDKKVWVGNAATTPIQLLGAGSSASFGALTCTSLTNSGLTSGRVTYATTAGLLTDSAGLTFDGTNFATTGTATATRFIPSGSTVATNGMYLPAANSIGISTNSTNAIYIDSSQNVGIGVSSPGQKLDVSTTGDIQLRLGNAATGAQFTYDIGRVASTGLLQFYGNQSGATGYIFSGVNGERMRIDSSGNVGINNTSPAVLSSTTQVAIKANTSADAMFVAQNSNGLTTAKFGFQFTGSVDNPVIGSFTNHPFLFFTNNTERMRIASDGSVGIGITNPNSYGKLAVNGSVGIAAGNYAYFYNSGNTNYSAIACVDTTGMAFYTAATERMRITSGGNLLVATTSTSGTSGIGFKINPFATYTQTSQVGSSTSNVDTTHEMYSTGAGAYRFYVGFGGTVYATNTTISGISDQRLKENIVDLDDGLNAVMALKPRKFDWKEGKGKNIKGDRGFIAQEFETVFPDMIEEWKDPAPEGEEPYKSVNANLIPTLVKAIQEQQAMIEELTNRIKKLEGV